MSVAITESASILKGILIVMVFLTIVVIVLFVVLIVVVCLKKATLKGTRTVSEERGDHKIYNVLDTDDAEADA